MDEKEIKEKLTLLNQKLNIHIGKFVELKKELKKAHDIVKDAYNQIDQISLELLQSQNDINNLYQE